MRLYLLLILAFVSLLQSCQNGETPPKKVQGYNVVFVVVDDLNDWISPLGGHPQSNTPNFDRLASQSLNFANAYCAAPTCNPSRVAMFTGKQPFKSGVYSNSDHFRESEVLKNATTLPQLFMQHGYKTFATGKVFHQPNGPLADPISWSVLRNEEGELMLKSPTKSETVLANGMEYQNLYEQLFDWEEQDISIESTSDFKNSQWAAQLIRTQEEAYFLACGIYKPHLPWYLPKGSFADFRLDSIVRVAIFKDDLADLPPETGEILRHANPRSDANRLAKYKKEQEATRAYLAAISFADKCLGNILNAIEENGDNTILIVVGDHGWHLGEKDHYRKFTLWERATHVPLFIRLPGGKNGGQVVEEFTSLIDLYPTIAAFCNLEMSDKLDGQSLLYLFEDPTKNTERAVLTTLGPGNVSMRFKDWRYIKYSEGGEELYDHQSDPNEWFNLAKEVQYRSFIDSLQSFLPSTFQASVSGKGHVVFDY